MPELSDELREQCGDVLLVGGTFFLNAKLVFENGLELPVAVDLKISERSGITFPKVKLRGRVVLRRKREGKKP